MDWDPSQHSFFVHIYFIIWLDIIYDWLEFNKVKLNIILALRPPLVVLTHFFITKHSVYYKWQIKELLALWYYVLWSVGLTSLLELGSFSANKENLHQEDQEGQDPKYQVDQEQEDKDQEYQDQEDQEDQDQDQEYQECQDYTKQYRSHRRTQCR